MIRLGSVAMLVAMVLFRIAALLVLMKFLAVQFGTSGFGQLSQILAVGALFSVLAGGGLTNGIVRNLAASDSASDRAAWIKAAIPIAAASAAALAGSAWLLYATAASALFPGQDLGFVLVIIACSQAVVGFGNIAHAYLSGTQNVRAFTMANAMGSGAAAALVAFLAYTAGFRGAAAGCAAMALMPAVFGMITAARSIDWRDLRDATFDRFRIGALLRFGGSMYLAAAAVPLVWVYVRSDLALREGWQAVGLWQSVTRISDAYMQVFGAIFMNYALPQLAAARPSERLLRLRYIAVLVAALFIPGTTVLYVFRDTILELAFSSAFANAAMFLAPQIAGDAFKLVSLVFVYYLMSLNRASILAWMELLQAALMLVTYGLLVQRLGAQAAVASYTLATLGVMTATLCFAAVTRNHPRDDRARELDAKETPAVGSSSDRQVSDDLRFLFIGFLVPDADLGRVFEGETHPQVSALHFQRRIVNALESAGASIVAVTTPPIASFPRNRNWWIGGTDYQLSGLRVRGRQVSGPNLPGVRLIVRLTQIVRHGLLTLPAPCAGILVYSVHTPMVAASLLLKRLRGVPVFVFIPDRPTFMGGPSNPLKRLLKRIDEKLVRQMLVYANGAFPVTEGTGRDWLGGRPKYWAQEGISDEAAGVLSQARATGAYVFRGCRRPRLLYTGSLAYVMPFAVAFHQSPIDAVVTFMGGGEDFVPLQELAAVDQRIEVKPFATGAEFTSEVDRADFLLNPRDPSWPGSAYSFPWKLFEYLQYGKPIISTRLAGVPPEYFSVFRPIDLANQPSFDASLLRALQVDQNPEAIWSGAERLADRLATASVGPRLLARIREWTREATSWMF